MRAFGWLAPCYKLRHMMGTDEIQVFEFLKGSPNFAASAREIARRVGGRKRLQQDPDWIRPVLRRLMMDELIESDEAGDYRLKVRGLTKPKAQKLTMENWQTWELVLDEPETTDAPQPQLQQLP